MGKAYRLDPEERLDWELQKEQQEQKKTAASAFKKPRRRGCRMPSDYLTKKQKQALNGEVKQMNIRKPMSYKEFKEMPTDLQGEYLTYLKNTFQANMSDIARMMGTTVNTLSAYIHYAKNSGIRVEFPKGGKSKLNCEAWQKFLNCPESDEKALCATNDISEGSEPVSENGSESHEKPRYDFDQTMNEVAAGFITLNDAMEMLGLPRVQDGDIKGINVPEGMTREEWLGELNRSFDEFADRQKKIFEQENQRRIDILKAEINRLEIELAEKNRFEKPEITTDCSKNPDSELIALEQKPLDLKIDRFSITLDDIRSWDETFELLRYVKIPKENRLIINLTETQKGVVIRE